MWIAKGEMSELLEAAAAAVGVGMVLGGFAAGVAGLLVGVERASLDWLVVRGGYVGAGLSLAARAAGW